MSTRLELIDSSKNHYKFWEAELSDSSTTLITRWGRIGTRGQSKHYEFASNISASWAYWEKVAEKRRKGYQDTTPTIPTIPDRNPSQPHEEKTTIPKALGHRSLSQYMN